MTKKVLIQMGILIAMAMLSVGPAWGGDAVEKILVRAEPGGKPVAVIKTDTPVEVTGESGQWVKITVSGWIRQSELSTGNRKARDYPSQVVNSPNGPFTVSGITFKQHPDSTSCSGTIRNDSQRKAKVVTFLMRVYGKDGRELESSFFTVDKLGRGKSKTFHADLRYTPPGAIFAVTVMFESSF